MPSFARQTGLPCATCHILAFGPALTPYGQQFKLNAYVQGNGQAPLLPLSGMLVGSLTNTQKGQDGGAAPHYASNDNLALDQASAFYGGRIADHVGAFVQVTYSGVPRRIHWDQTDIRFADHGHIGDMPLVYGLSLNNNPTVQDLWNSTPGWSFPYQSSSLAPTPAAAPLLEGALAQNVYGLTAYTMIDRTLYLEGGAYRSPAQRVLSLFGADPGGGSPVRGFAPYWRVTLQHLFKSIYASVGTFGLVARLTPGGNAAAGTDHYIDLGADTTFQWQIDASSALHGNATFLHESQRLQASEGPSTANGAANHLETTRINLTYAWRQTLAAELGWFAVNGSTDTALYAPAPVSGSANGSPASRGFIYQAEYIPFGKGGPYARTWLNLRMALQYTQYLQFNGGVRNYDGSGRDAADN
ncbi:MAG: cytochrome C, partial [Nevskia sp.]|nr:cytochrome C [Nevskia sp.]